jgi:hypothetical protein
VVDEGAPPVVGKPGARDTGDGDMMLRPSQSAVSVRELADSPQSRCRYCGRPIVHYAKVGWVDLTAIYRGGTYDMCFESASGSHSPG